MCYILPERRRWVNMNIQDTHWRSLAPQQRCSQYIQQPRQMWLCGNWSRVSRNCSCILSINIFDWKMFPFCMKSASYLLIFFYMGQFHIFTPLCFLTLFTPHRQLYHPLNRPLFYLSFVSSLLILSSISPLFCWGFFVFLFVLFSFYFHLKFKQWQRQSKRMSKNY